VTVVGTTVNAASRLEAMTKEHDCQLIVSTAASELAGWPAVSPEQGGVTVNVRGLSEPLAVRVVARARDLPPTFFYPQAAGNPIPRAGRTGAPRGRAI
jgi:adenylate cyclase